MKKIASPCIQVCSLEINSGHCYGCGRSRQEINDWQTMCETTRQKIMAQLPARLKKIPRPPRRITRRAKLQQNQKAKNNV